MKGLYSLTSASARREFGVTEIAALDEFFLPQSERVKALYTRASLAGQHVIVAMT